MQTVKALLLMPMVVLALSACAVRIKDARFCAPVPGHLGAVCDSLLSSDQKILSEDEWDALQATWVNAGQAVECTTSQTIGDLKGEIEKLCSIAPCDIKTKKKLLKGMKKIMMMGARSNALGVQ